MRAALSIALCSFLAACTDHDVTEVAPSGGGETLDRYHQERDLQLDILFVIDDSASMEDEQSSIGARFGELTRALETLPGGLPSVHIGVVSSTVGLLPFTAQSCPALADDGKFRVGAQVGASCRLRGRFIQDEKLPDGTRVKNYDGTLAEVFACTARLGTAGCQFEQHLEAIKRALSEPANTGFLRDHATLAVIVLADEDDCSAAAGNRLFDPSDRTLGAQDGARCTAQAIVCKEDVGQPGLKTECRSNEGSPLVQSVQSYVDFLRQRKGDRVITAAIVAERAPFEIGASGLASNCNLPGREARPGVRLASFVEAFGADGVVTSICADDYTPALRAIGERITRKLEGQCVRGRALALAPGDPFATPVLGGDFGVWCTVTDIGPGQPDRVLEACGGQAVRPCWRPMIDATECPSAASPQNLEIAIERDPAQDVHNLVSEVRCLTPPPGQVPPGQEPDGLPLAP